MEKISFYFLALPLFITLVLLSSCKDGRSGKMWSLLTIEEVNCAGPDLGVENCAGCLNYTFYDDGTYKFEGEESNKGNYAVGENIITFTGSFEFVVEFTLTNGILTDSDGVLTLTNQFDNGCQVIYTYE